MLNSDSPAARLLELKQEFLIPCVNHFYRNPPVLVRGEMQYLVDTEGRRYLDCYSGVTVMNCGHCNPAITEPVIEQIRALQHTTSIYLTSPMLELAHELIGFINGSLKRVFFVNSGSEANEGALLLARLHTGKPGFIAVRGGLHGRTHLTMSLTGVPMWQTDPFPSPSARLAPRPHCAQCELGQKPETCQWACATALAALIDHDTAAVIVEPIQGNGGIIVPPDGYFRRLREITREHGVLLIFDEIQTGFGRTGADFAFQHLGVEPDILTLAKALGNGFPIGAFCTTDRIAASYTKPGASTTGGNAVSATAARQVLRVLREHDLSRRAARLGEGLRQRFERTARTVRGIREVRGRGLMQAMELGSDANPMTAETDAILEAMKDRGFLIGKTGLHRNTLTVMPPLVITEAEITALGDQLEQVMGELCGWA
jgi:4-aminobutyrate aminotransferase/4-aminobutyrate aminotransferase/(S)-3-amino-2-methylpropionate transaminase